MNEHGIYEAAGTHPGEYEPVIVIGFTDLAGRPLDATLLPHERSQAAVYAIVRRNAGHGEQHLVEAGRLHADALGSCNVVRREVSTGDVLACLMCGVRSESFIPAEVTA